MVAQRQSMQLTCSCSEAFLLQVLRQSPVANQRIQMLQAQVQRLGQGQVVMQNLLLIMASKT